MKHLIDLTRRSIVANYGTPNCDNCGESVSRFIAVSYELPVQQLCLTCYALDNKSALLEKWNTAKLGEALSRQVKQDVGCEVCGYGHLVFALQFAHLVLGTKATDKTGKTINPSDGFRFWGLAKAVAEINKCRILDTRCHTIQTALERGMGCGNADCVDCVELGGE